MNDIGLLISTFGGGGVLVWFLIKQLTVTDRQQSKGIQLLGAAIDDLVLLNLELLDQLAPGYGKKRTSQAIKQRVEARRVARQVNAASQDVLDAPNT